MLHYFIRPIFRLFLLTLPFWIAFRIYKAKSGRKKEDATFDDEIGLFLFYAYMTCVIAITLVPTYETRISYPEVLHVNIIPLVHTVKEFLAGWHQNDREMIKHSLVNIVGNVLMFFPLGIFLPSLSAKFRKFKTMLLFAFLFSFGIEFAQFLSRYVGNYRYSDIDDVILNTLGACLGYAAYKILSWIASPPKALAKRS